MAAPYVCTFSIILLAVCFPPPSCLAAELMTWKCDNGTYYAANTTYQSNVRSLLASLAANASRSSPVGFATAILGAGTDMVWGLGLCRGDTNGTDCGSCLSLVPIVAFGQCQGVKDVSVFYDRCILRYSYRDFLTNPDNTQVQVSQPSKQNVTSGAERFNALVAYLVGALSDLAAFNTTTRYAVGLVTSDKGFPATTSDVVHSINGMVQCTPDQAPRACRGCLQALMDVMQALMDEMPASFNGSIGGQINAVWCNLRYEVFEFYDGSPMVRLVAPPWIPPSSTEQAGNGARGRENGATVSAIVLGVVVILILSIFTIYLWRNAKAKKSQTLPNDEDDHSGSLLFDLPTLIYATANFAQENKLGHGGFGAVYKGILPDGREIAVKRLDRASSQGLKELRNELLLVAKLRHNNLAKLLGVCLKGQEKLLVYEYQPNRSLDTIIFEPEKRAQLDWYTRYKIIYGTARGLLYLHEDSQIKIIHRDLKASNILLDADMNPKISDFGLARLFNSNETTTVTSQVVGTLGYMAPEYAVLGHVSVKLDVYSFGVLIMEIVTGRRNNDVFESVEESSTLLSYVWASWTRGTPLEITDPTLDIQTSESEVLRCIHLALLCVQENPADRPTMLSILVMLHGEASSFPPPSKPAFAFAFGGIEPSKTDGTFSSSGGPGEQRAAPPVSVNSMSVSEFSPR